MTDKQLIELLQNLIACSEAWGDLLRDAPDARPRALGAEDCAALVDEVRALAAEYHVPPPRRTRRESWGRALGLVSVEVERRRCERALLHAYERLCEVDAPLHLSSTLLRHYSTLKRATQLAADPRPSAGSRPALQPSRALASAR